MGKRKVTANRRKEGGWREKGGVGARKIINARKEGGRNNRERGRMRAAKIKHKNGRRNRWREKKGEKEVEREGKK